MKQRCFTGWKAVPGDIERKDTFMKTATLALAASLLAGTAMAPIAMAQTTTPGNTAPGATSTAPMPGVSSNTGTTPGTGMVDRNSGNAAAAGDRNQAVATTSANAPQPARGKNSFTEGEARRRIERNGYTNVMGLKKDDAGVWRGNASKSGQSEAVWLDYKGNVGPHPAPANTRASTTRATNTNAADGTAGNPPGTAAGRAVDRTLGTNTTGANPTGTNTGTTRP
jgi:hypothetical protein